MTAQQRFAEALDLALQYVDFREPDEVELALAATLRELRDAVLKGQEVRSSAMLHLPFRNGVGWDRALVIPLERSKP